MTTEEKIKLLESRLHQLKSRDKENYGVCRKIERTIQNLKMQDTETRQMFNGNIFDEMCVL